MPDKRIDRYKISIWLLFVIWGTLCLSISVRAAMHADDVADTVRAADNVVDTVNALYTAADAQKAAGVLNPVGDVAGALCSFSADTPVTTEEGETQISAIETGDAVLAWNEAENRLDYYPVTAVWSHDDPVIVNLLLDGEWIETTPEHPFYVEGKGWLTAEDLSFGMQVHQADGTTGLVWWKWSVHQTQAMYNLTVDTAHTYFVGQGQWLVHNACPGLPDRQLGDKTRGLLDLGDEQIQFTSGRSGPSSTMPPNTPGMSYNGVDLAIKDHVEAHAAAIMRQRGATNATLYINNTPCGGKLGCNNMLPHMLPENARLDVYTKTQGGCVL